MIVQIYEIQKPEDVAPLVGLGVDRIGSVVLDAQQWKSEKLKQTIETVRQLGAESSLIPLFSDVETISAALAYYRPDIVHLCEDICPKTAADRLVRRQAEIKARFPDILIMRSIPIAPPGGANAVPTRERAKIFEPVSDIFLTDTLLPPADNGGQDQPVSGFVGITGQTCDWDMAAQLVLQSRIPVILAGGISPENVCEGIRKTRPAGVDSCTQTNQSDGDGRPIRFRKDLEKVRALVTAVRTAANETSAGRIRPCGSHRGRKPGARHNSR